MNIRFEDVEDLHRRMRLWFGVCFLLTCGLSAFLIGCGAVLHNLPPWASVVAFSLLGGLMVVLAWQWLTLREANHDVRRGLSNLLFVDNLTKVFNSRYVMERLGFELKRAERRGQSLSVLYLDLNDFKSINDTLGHDAGDDVLEELGRLLRRCVRENDTLGRLGGDEFLMILPDTTVASARKLGERIKNITAGHVFRYRGKRIPVWLSIGPATYPQDARDKDRLLIMADNAMYEDKRQSKQPHPDYISTQSDGRRSVGLLAV